MDVLQYNVFVVVIAIVGLWILYKLCDALWNTVRIVSKLQWPNATWGYLCRPNFFRSLYDPQALVSTLSEIVNKGTSFVVYGSGAAVITNDPTIAQAVLTNPNALDKGEFYKPLKEIVGQSLISAPVERWRALRRLLTPSFHKTMTDSFIPAFMRSALLCASELEKHVDKEEFDVKKYTKKVIFNSSDTLYGTTLEDGEAEKIFEMMDSIIKSVFKRMILVFKLPYFIYDRTTEGKKYRSSLKTADTKVCEIMERRKKVLALEKEPHGNDSEESSDDIRKCIRTNRRFIDVLLDEEVRSRYKFTDKEIKGELMTMSFAATDTVHTLLVSTFLLLSQNPDVQEKVYKELYEIYGSSDPKDVPVAVKDLGRMEYTECVLKEALRLFSPAPLIARQPTEDIQIGDKVIPAGCTVVIMLRDLHRDEKYWKDPMKFDPDRFLPENSVDRSPFLHMPFSYGSRNCPGYSYAMSVAKTILAVVLRRYTISSDRHVKLVDVKTTVNITATLAEPVKIKIRRRQS